MSIAIDVVSGFIAVLGVFQARKHARQAQENEVVQQQEQLKQVMVRVNLAKEDPKTTSGQLLDLFNELVDAGDKFYRYATGFSMAGPGAIRTIFGQWGSNGWVPSPPEAPGYFTVFIRSVADAIIRKNKNDGEVGNLDLSDFEDVFKNIGNAIAVKISGKKTTPSGTVDSVLAGTPGWVIPVGLLVVVLLMTQRNRG